MPLFGSHLSIAGGYYKAADAAAQLDMQTVQIFTKNNNQWRAKPLTDEDAERFKSAVEKAGLKSCCAHNSYLINLGSANVELFEKSRDAMIIELERAEALGLSGVVMHPGSFVEDTEAGGLKRIAKGIDQVHKATKGFRTELWLETTAGQGTCLGHRFEHLREIIDRVKQPELLGVCVDTCHIFAAGYPIGTEEEYRSTFQEFDDVIGLDRIRAFHINDSKKPCGSRVDRHDHIGEGHLGLEPFRHLVNDPRFDELPMYLETKKEKRDGVEMDAVNLKTLQGLIAKKKRSGTRKSS
ncbi:deoxyribonuclease IV [Rubinisphaera margarita]|uniref:deoxyribonuclease IV n=1 Tax=Rubinisphaera margarita TaxID=2909586 RepID=UPI001EE7F75A|nr:deoxyribonuclease IV [Rubinisphaera margarita]MCG6155745.1 deoxyribonuclease IV [Rubinisphaera margarita]